LQMLIQHSEDENRSDTERREDVAEIRNRDSVMGIGVWREREAL